MALTDSERDGPYSRTRHFSWTRPIQEAAPALDASD